MWQCYIGHRVGVILVAAVVVAIIMISDAAVARPQIPRAVATVYCFCSATACSILPQAGGHGCGKRYKSRERRERAKGVSQEGKGVKAIAFL